MQPIAVERHVTPTRHVIDQAYDTGEHHDASVQLSNEHKQSKEPEIGINKLAIQTSSAYGSYAAPYPKSALYQDNKWEVSQRRKKIRTP